MPSCCGLPCFNQRHSEETTTAEEKAVPVSATSSKSTTVPKPATRTTDSKFREIDWTPADKGLTFKNDEKTTTTTTVSTKVENPPTNEQGTNSTQSQPTANTTNQSSEPMADQLKGAASGVTNTVSSGAQQASSGVQSAAGSAQNATSPGAQQASSGVQSAAGSAQDTASNGTQSWNAMSEEQKKATYDALPDDKKKGMSYYEWIKQGYHNQMENWMPWIEDQYLKWFTNDNKASYATKDALDQTKVTGVSQVDTLQDSVNYTVGQQVGKGGVLQPVGDYASSEGINRAERSGQDNQGSYLGSMGNAASSAGGSVWSGAKSAGGYVGGMFGGKKEEGGAVEESK